MMSTLPFWFVLVVILSKMEPGKSDTLFNSVFSSLNKLIDYVETDYTDVNADGLFALRISQGELKQGLNQIRSNGIQVAPSTLKKAEDLRHKMDELNNEIGNHLDGRKATAYSKRFAPLSSRPWEGRVEYRHVNAKLPKASLNYMRNNVMNYNENFGDMCYSLILGTAKYLDKTTFPKCTVSKRCVDHLLSPKRLPTLTMYGPTHTALYIYLAKQNGCEDKVQALMMDRNISTVIGDICTKSYAEAKVLFNHGLQPFTDAFMEQIVICGGLFGFEEFYRKDWWDIIKAFQYDIGCYKNVAPAYGILKELYELQLKKQLTKTETRFRSRKLLRDQTMKDNCSAHETGMAAGVMGSYIRYMLEHDGHLYR